MKTVKNEFEYSAKRSYDHKGAAESYEALRFSGFLGRYRYRREQRAVKALIERLPKNVRILDCPCGTGRWWPLLSRRASEIMAVDMSEEMLRFARQRASQSEVPVTVVRGDAEQLDLDDGAVDYVFSHALTKHLPLPVQFKVLREFSRVATGGVVCSFGIFNHLTYEMWRRRQLEESYPVLLEQLQWMAKEAQLLIRKTVRCTTPVGVEHAVLFEKKK
jgi:ubiquinone/menaquinone biosynthesis C-methylase UbiE